VSRAHNINSSSIQKSERLFTISHVGQKRRYYKISTIMRPTTWLWHAIQSKVADPPKNVRMLQCTELSAMLSYIGRLKTPPLYSKGKLICLWFTYL